MSVADQGQAGISYIGIGIKMNDGIDTSIPTLVAVNGKEREESGVWSHKLFA